LQCIDAVFGCKRFRANAVPYPSYFHENKGIVSDSLEKEELGNAGKTMKTSLSGKIMRSVYK
jgi:hypothetical protein